MKRLKRMKKYLLNCNKSEEEKEIIKNIELLLIISPGIVGLYAMFKCLNVCWICGLFMIGFALTKNIIKLIYARNKKTKKTGFYVIVISLSLCSFPLIFLKTVGNFLGKTFSIRNLNIIVTLYCYIILFFVVSIMLGAATAWEISKELNPVMGIMCLLVFYLSFSLVKKFIFHMWFLDSPREKYDYFLKHKDIDNFLLLFFTMLMGVIGLIMQQPDTIDVPTQNALQKQTIYLLITTTIFTSLGQIFSFEKRNKKDKILIELYNEVIFWEKVIFSQIQNHPFVKFRIKFSIEEREILTYKAIIYNPIYKKKNREQILEVLDRCIDIQTKDYKLDVYEDIKRLKNDFNGIILILAEYLAT